MIDVGTLKGIRAGQIQVRPGIAEFFEKGVVFQDGRREEFSAIVCATGYTSNAEKLFDATEWKGIKNQGLAEAEGLYFIGFDNVLTGFLRQIGIRARQVVAQIASTRSF